MKIGPPIPIEYVKGSVFVLCNINRENISESVRAVMNTQIIGDAFRARLRHRLLPIMVFHHHEPSFLEFLFDTPKCLPLKPWQIRNGLDGATCLAFLVHPNDVHTMEQATIAAASELNTSAPFLARWSDWILPTCKYCGWEGDSIIFRNVPVKCPECYWQPQVKREWIPLYRIYPENVLHELYKYDFSTRRLIQLDNVVQWNPPKGETKQVVMKPKSKK
jgi:hypothetical protein